MKWRPAPVVIGNPRPAVVGIKPVAVRIIGPEISHGRHPGIAIISIIYPIAIGAQVVIELLIGDLILRLIIFPGVRLVVSGCAARRN
jgi:hypothetical protein